MRGQVALMMVAATAGCAGSFGPSRQARSTTVSPCADEPLVLRARWSIDADGSPRALFQRECRRQRVEHVTERQTERRTGSGAIYGAAGLAIVGGLLVLAAGVAELASAIPDFEAGGEDSSSESHGGGLMAAAGVALGGSLVVGIYGQSHQQTVVHERTLPDRTRAERIWLAVDLGAVLVSPWGHRMVGMSDGGRAGVRFPIDWLAQPTLLRQQLEQPWRVLSYDLVVGQWLPDAAAVDRMLAAARPGR